MWTKKEIDQFKDTIRREEGEAVLKVGHGETVTVRVPTHLDGKSLYWWVITSSRTIVLLVTVIKAPAWSRDVRYMSFI